jgi:DNA-directed RNA polymerase subunit RPC12/RpoP
MGAEAKCFECGELIEVPEDASGKKIVCPHCSARLQVEEDGTIARAGAGAEVTAAPRPASPVREQDDDEDDVPRRRRRWRDEEDEEEEYPRRRRRRSFRKTGLTRQEALDKVRAPGTILQIFGVLLIISGLGSFVALPFAAQAQKDVELLLFVFGLSGIVCLPCGFITFLGGTRFKQLRSRGLVLATLILTFIIAVLFCNPAIVVPIWPLIVFMDANVKEHFDRPVEEIDYDD